MQVFSVISTLPTADSVSTDTGNGNSSSSGSSFADTLGATLEQSGQTQQTTTATQSGTASQEGQSAQPETTEGQGVAAGKTVATASAEDTGTDKTNSNQTTTSNTSTDVTNIAIIRTVNPNIGITNTDNSNAEETGSETAGEVVDLMTGTGNTVTNSSGKPTGKLVPEEPETEESEPEEEDSQAAAAQPQPAMVYLSPFFMNQLNLNQTTAKTADSTIKIDAGNSSGELVSAVTDGTAAVNAGTSVNTVGNAAGSTATTQTAFDLSAAATAVVQQNGASVILPQDETVVKLPQQAGTRTTDNSTGQSSTVDVTGQSGGEDLISRIAQALLQQDGSMTDDTSGKASDASALTQGIDQGTDDTVPNADALGELPVSLNTTTFAVQVEDGVQGKTAAVNEIIDRFTQDFKGADSCPGEINITLTPENLGELKISIHMTDSGGVTAHITAKDKDICALISSQIGRLVESMERKGVTVENVDVVYDQLGNNQSSGQGSYQNQRNGQGNSQFATGTDQIADDANEDTVASAPTQFVNTKVISTGNSLSY